MNSKELAEELIGYNPDVPETLDSIVLTVLLDICRVAKSRGGSKAAYLGAGKQYKQVWESAEKKAGIRLNIQSKLICEVNNTVRWIKENFKKQSPQAFFEREINQYQKGEDVDPPYDVARASLLAAFGHGDFEKYLPEPPKVPHVSERDEQIKKRLEYENFREYRSNLNR